VKWFRKLFSIFFKNGKKKIFLPLFYLLFGDPLGEVWHTPLSKEQHFVDGNV
jgi:hypothetical protein